MIENSCRNGSTTAREARSGAHESPSLAASSSTTTRRLAAFAFIALALGCTAACGGAESDTRPTTEPRPTSIYGLEDEDTGQTITPEPAPSWDAKSREDATTAAARAMELYARPDVTQKEWADDLAPLMTAQAKEDYSFVEPVSIAATSVTGPATIVEEPSPKVVHVSVPTDVGTYTVLLIRQSQSEPWLTSKFTLPEGLN